MISKLLVPVLLLSLLAACERPAPQVDAAEERRQAEQMRELDARIARLQELEDRGAERKVAETQAERDRLLREKADLEAERDRLTASRNAAKAQATRAEREASAAEARAQEVARSAEEDRANAQIDFFYPALDPHGEWREVEGLGYCWQPRAAEVRSWRPYTDGRWVFTEYGWTWNSNEPFGWAVYHYGRWTRLPRVGWLWVPGTEWGPAWVSWRRSDDYIGWAPLPPDAWSATGFNAAVDDYYDIGPGSYSFVAADSLGAQNYVAQVVAPEQNVTIIEKTVNITNVTYKKVENTTVVYNAGPDLERVNSKGGEKVPRLKVERVTDVREPAKAGLATQKGGVLRMAAPRLAEGKKSGATPQRLKERIGSKAADRGWSEVPDKVAAEQIRTRAKEEARKVEDRDRNAGRNERLEATPAPIRPAATPRVETPVKPPAPARATPAPVEKVAEPAAQPEPATPAATPSVEKATAPPERPARERQRRREERSSAAKASATPPAAPAGEPIVPAAPAEEKVPTPIEAAAPPEAEMPKPTEPASPEAPENAAGTAETPAPAEDRPRQKAGKRQNSEAAAATPRPGRNRQNPPEPAGSPAP